MVDSFEGRLVFLAVDDAKASRLEGAPCKGAKVTHIGDVISAETAQRMRQVHTAGGVTEPVSTVGVAAKDNLRVRRRLAHRALIWR